MIKVIIVDDEYLGRVRICNLLHQDKRFNIIEDIGNSVASVEVIAESQPDVLFLDIEMPGLNGLGLVKQIQAIKNYDPIIVFITAHQNYAIDAFEVSAIDYLRKPFTDQRFQTSLNRIIQAIELRNDANVSKKIQKILNTQAAKGNPNYEYIEVKDKGIKKTIYLKHILYFKAFGNYVKIYTLEDILLHRVTLKELEEFLNPLLFTRISRFIILANTAISNVNYKGQGEYEFTLFNRDKVTSTSLYKSKVSHILGL